MRPVSLAAGLGRALAQVSQARAHESCAHASDDTATAPLSRATQAGAWIGACGAQGGQLCHGERGVARRYGYPLNSDARACQEARNAASATNDFRCIYKTHHQNYPCTRVKSSSPFATRLAVILQHYTRRLGR